MEPNMEPAAHRASHAGSGQPALANRRAYRTRQGLGQDITLTIDGNPVTVPLGTTILEAARQLEIRIPTLCFHEDLCLAGVCRVCVVEIEGQRQLQSACSYPLTAPIRVSTHSAKVRRARRHVIDLLLASHLRRVLQLQPQQPLRAAATGCRIRRRRCSASATSPSRGTRSTPRATPWFAT